ncbi:protein Star-like [Penaeus japonicus]|uniref:protein Star-like n=1 Tax=Penaeus japonicus TaxID=27405 RepID=UPI001C712D66|nr:protein Star-like [Penaeus japonicus]
MFQRLSRKNLVLKKSHHSGACCGLLITTAIFVFVSQFVGLSFISNLNEDHAFWKYLKTPLGAEDPIVLEVLKKHYLLPPQVSKPYNLTSVDPESKHFNKLVSWDVVHRYVRQFFDKQRGGFFVEAGALDGQYFSNTLWLEKERGWTGLLVEPDALNFQHLVWRRRKAWISNTCITPGQHPREATFESMNRPGDSLMGTIGWLYRANTREFKTQMSYNDEMSATSFKSYSRAQCFPLASYLAALNVSKVDFLSLDIQGGEWEVIHSLPLDRITIRAIAVEHFNSRVAEESARRYDLAFATYMKERGYRFLNLDDQANYIFVLESDPLLGAISDTKLTHENVET